MPATIPVGLSARLELPDIFERGVVNILKCPVYISGALTAPTSGTVSIYDASGAALVSAQSVTITSNIAQYSYTPASTLSLSEDWYVVWDLVIGDETYRFQNEAMLVKSRLVCPVTTSDIWKLVPSLDQTGSKPMTAMTAAAQDGLIQEAWNSVQLKLIQAGRRPWLVVSPYALRDVVINTALALIFAALSSRLDDAFTPQSMRYYELAENAWKLVKLKHNEDDDNAIDAGRISGSKRPAVVWLGGRI